MQLKMTYQEYILLRIKTLSEENVVRFPIEHRINSSPRVQRVRDKRRLLSEIVHDKRIHPQKKYN